MEGWAVTLGTGLLSILVALYIRYPFFNNRWRERKNLVDQLSELRSTLVQVKNSKSKIDDHLTINSDSLEKSEEYPNMEKDILIIIAKCASVNNKYDKIIGNEASWIIDTVTTGSQEPEPEPEPEPQSVINVPEPEPEPQSVINVPEPEPQSVINVPEPEPEPQSVINVPEPEPEPQSVINVPEPESPMPRELKNQKLAVSLSVMTDKLRELEHTMPEHLKNMTWSRHPLKNLKLAKCSRDIAKNVKLAVAVRERLKVENMTMRSNSNRIYFKKFDEVSNVLPVFNVHATKVLDSLRLGGKSIVGITGLPGVGKTTTLKRVHNRVIEEGLQFEHLIWIDFPLEKEVDEIYEKMQVEIMRQLSISSNEATTSIAGNQYKISSVLNAKKYLLIIDQVSRPVDLDKLFGLKDDHIGMNVVMASSNEKHFPVTNEVIPIEALSEGHAWELFKKVYGEEIDDSDLIEIAKMIVRCCGGIPTYINLMVAYLKKKKSESKSLSMCKSLWRDAKRILKSQSKSCEHLDLAGLDKMYEKIYLDIQDISAKKCLLYGALFPLQHKIYKDYLVECWIAEGFIDVPDKRLQSCRDRGETTLVCLTGTFLMEWCSDEKYVKMHPIFRRVALELDYPDVDPSKKIITWVPSEVQASNENDQNAGARMSMIGSKTELPEIPKGYNIYTLLLQKKVNLQNFENLFFNCMPKLQVLDLYKTNIEALPESIKVLINLKGLYLNGCARLENLPPEAAKLVVLEFLDIRSTKMSSLPEVIGSMVNLRCLRASLHTKISNRSTKGKEPPNILNRLEKLEELFLDSDQIDNQCRADMAESLKRKLASLKYLTIRIQLAKCQKMPQMDIERDLPREDVASTSQSVEEITLNNN